MELLFLKILNMSITASWLIVPIICIRKLKKNIPVYLRYILWGMIVFRLVCPVSIESITSIVPSNEFIVETGVRDSLVSFNTGIEVIDSGMNNAVGDYYAENSSKVSTTNVLSILTGIWFVGFWFINFCVNSFAKEEKVKLKVRFATIILAIHWFNPLVWIVHRMFLADNTAALVVKLAKKAGVWKNNRKFKDIVFSVIVCGILAAFLITNPRTDGKNMYGDMQESGIDLYTAEREKGKLAPGLRLNTDNNTFSMNIGSDIILGTYLLNEDNLILKDKETNKMYVLDVSKGEFVVKQDIDIVGSEIKAGTILKETIVEMQGVR